MAAPAVVQASSLMPVRVPIVLRGAGGDEFIETFLARSGEFVVEIELRYGNGRISIRKSHPMRWRTAAQRRVGPFRLATPVPGGFSMSAVVNGDGFRALAGDDMTEASLRKAVDHIAQSAMGLNDPFPTGRRPPWWD